MTKNNFKKIIFLDRDGVINKKADDHEYITNVEHFVFTDEIFNLLNKFKDKKYEFIIITNQRGIARGKMTEDDLKKIHNNMINRFKENHIEILDIFYCPHDVDSCDCRKPKPGLLNQATKKFKIDLNESIFFSDSMTDILMGQEYGINKNIFLKTDTLKKLKIISPKNQNLCTTKK